jgi:hypothetical protein
MTLNTIINIASSGYPDDRVKLCWNPLKQTVVRHRGDGLAEFIANELSDTYETGVPTKEQLKEAARAMRVARDELESVYSILRRYQAIASIKDRDLPQLIGSNDPFIEAILEERLKSV